MSIRYSIAQRTPLQNGLFAGIACAVALTLTVGPALARPIDRQPAQLGGQVAKAQTLHQPLGPCERPAGDAG
ncbi:MAG: hypothetical protein GXC94_10715 [Comamonadaceae bacterium]|jgi:hypothetical protein|nr:hypothetical protein [Comamonadaceae bacterium]